MKKREKMNLKDAICDMAICSTIYGSSTSTAMVLWMEEDYIDGVWIAFPILSVISFIAFCKLAILTFRLVKEIEEKLKDEEKGEDESERCD